MGVRRAIRDNLMSRCEMIWTTAGTNRVCSRCLELKGKIIGTTDEEGIQIPPLHPRCRCAIIYREIGFSFDVQRFGVQEELQRALTENKIKGELIYPPPILDLSRFIFDAKHTQGDKHPHDVTEQEARKFIDDAYFVLVRYNGNSYNYYGRAGAAFIRRDLQTIRTAFKAEEYDEKIRKLIEVTENELKRK